MMKKFGTDIKSLMGLTDNMLSLHTLKKTWPRGRKVCSFSWFFLISPELCEQPSLTKKNDEILSQFSLCFWAKGKFINYSFIWVNVTREGVGCMKLNIFIRDTQRNIMMSQNFWSHVTIKHHYNHLPPNKYRGAPISGEDFSTGACTP